MKFKIILVLTIIFSITIVAGSLYTKKLIDELPSISHLENYTPSIVTRIFDRNERLITELFVERRVLVPLKDIPLDLQNAFLATEDNDFYNHWGISTKGILRAFVTNLLKGKVAQGGSTITQQLSKTIFLTAERTITRKIKEVDIKLKSIDKQVSNNIVEQMSQFESNKRNKKVKKSKNSNNVENDIDINEIIKTDTLKSKDSGEIELDIDIPKIQKKNTRRRGSSIGQTRLLKEIEEYVEQNMKEMYKAIEELKQSYEGEINEAVESGFEEIAESLRNDLKFEEENLTAQYEEERMKQIEIIREKHKKS